MFKWLINFRANLSLLRALRRCMKTYERLCFQAMREGNVKLVHLYENAMRETAKDYEELRIRIFGKLSFII